MLMEEGKLTLDDKLNKYFPDAPEGWRNITIRHLLTHTSGMTDYPQGFDFRRDYTEDELYERAKVIPLAFQPGDKWSYSNLGYVMLGILTPTAGDVWIGGLRLAAIDPDALRRTVASVTQSDTLFAGSIADNISFFDAQGDQAWIEECARIAAIHAEIAALPMGYNTFVGYSGSMLSAGQQQRILLARALYARPSILVLDEATSHLDVKREIIVSSAIRALNVTRVIVAHRPQTTATADRIVTLDGGRIVREARLASGPVRRPHLEAVASGSGAALTTEGGSR